MMTDTRFVWYGRDPGRGDSLSVQPTPRPGGPGHRLPPADRDRSERS